MKLSRNELISTVGNILSPFTVAEDSKTTDNDGFPAAGSTFLDCLISLHSYSQDIA